METYKISGPLVINKTCLTEEGYTATCIGWPLVGSFPQQTRATQYQSGAGRWGWLNYHSSGFSADGGWYLLYNE